MKTKEKEENVQSSLTRLLAVRDLEKLLLVDRRTVYRMCELGQLPRPFKIGGANRWKADAVLQVIEKAEARTTREPKKKRRVADIG